MRAIIVFFIGLICLPQWACKKERELVTLASNIGFSAAQSATEADAMLIGALDMVKNFKNPSAFTVIPATAGITYVDSVFSDGTGVRFIVDFGPLQDEKPKGLLCLDGKYRAGVMECSMRLPFQDSGNRMNAHEQAGFYTGNGTEMFELKGNINLERTGPKSWKANEDLWINALHLNPMTWKADFNVQFGMESHSYTGSANGRTSDDDKPYEVTIIDALIKRDNCPNTFVLGTCEVSADSEVAFLDFNPYSDEVCDEVARVSLNRYEKIFYIH